MEKGIDKRSDTCYTRDKPCAIARFVKILKKKRKEKKMSKWYNFYSQDFNESFETLNPVPEEIFRHKMVLNEFPVIMTFTPFIGAKMTNVSVQKIVSDTCSCKLESYCSFTIRISNTDSFALQIATREVYDPGTFDFSVCEYSHTDEWGHWYVLKNPEIYLYDENFLNLARDYSLCLEIPESWLE